jgi:hypothetical protein
MLSRAGTQVSSQVPSASKAKDASGRIAEFYELQDDIERDEGYREYPDALPLLIVENYYPRGISASLIKLLANIA